MDKGADLQLVKEVAGMEQEHVIMEVAVKELAATEEEGFRLHGQMAL